jgi:hypothetical protein
VFLASQSSPVTAASTPAAKATRAQAALDAHMDAYSGPYTVEGRAVLAPAQFRMAGGFNQKAANEHASALAAICAKAHVDATSSLGGYPTPSQLTKVTQALIDAGKLQSGPEDVATRIKAMQWSWGIGVDCTDYALGAATKASGIKPPGAQMGTDYFQNPANKPFLRSVKLADVRPGDVFSLASPDPKEAGHRAVVYSASVCAPERAALLSRTYPDAQRYLAGGPVRMFEVDSSWGAGRFGSPSGGVRRDTWLYNESTQTWAELRPAFDPSRSSPIFNVTTDGPHGEILQSISRFRGQP